MRSTVLGFDPFGTFTPPPAGGAPQTGSYLDLPFVPQLLACTACPARLEARQVVPGAGPLDARILVIGQNPGDEEDQVGVPFIGNAGQEFGVWLRMLGLDRAKLVVTNIVRCHTLNNRAPRTKEIKTCADLWLAAELQGLQQVSVLVPLGKPAVVAVLGKDSPPMTPPMAHHYRARAYGRELHVFPLPHPAFFLRARHLAPMFHETVLTHLRLTLQQEVPDVYEWSKVAGKAG